MPYTLVFRNCFSYTRGSGVCVEAILRYAGKTRHLVARIDTGAEFCVFAREIGEELGLDIERGTPQRLSTLNGEILAYGHRVGLEALGYEVEATIYFRSDYNQPRNLLGRRGWIDRFRLALIDHDEHIYISHYDEEG
jgi:hypothetical protein